MPEPKTPPELQMNHSRTECGLAIRVKGSGTLADADLLSKAIGQELQQELQRRGYDLFTLRFSIRKRKDCQ
jgi:hypothetical protein